MRGACGMRGTCGMRGKYENEFGDEPYPEERIYYLMAECAVLAVDALRLVQDTGSPGDALAWEPFEAEPGWTAEVQESVTYRGVAERPRIAVEPGRCRVRLADIMLTGLLQPDGVARFGFEDATEDDATEDVQATRLALKYTILEP
jgi:hypothetical protein